MTRARSYTRGSSVDDLIAAFPFLSTPEWDVSALTDSRKWCEDKPGEWIHPKPVEERLEPFMKSLRDRPEEKVAVVGHSGVMERLLETFPGNCEVIEKEI